MTSPTAPETVYGYDALGRQNRVVSPFGTITRTVYDARGNVLSTWQGTDGTDASDTDPTGAAAAGNNMVKVSSATYDADGNLLTSTAHADATHSYTTTYQYDWRDRLTDVLLPGDVVQHTDYDNLDRVLWSKTYASTGFLLTADELRSASQNLYDARGRVYESRTYEVDPLSGAVGDYLPSSSWYDAAGNLIKTADGNGLFQKYSYDGLGRLVTSYTSYDTDETGYVEADDMDGDTVIEQTRYYYDAAGQTVAAARFQRLPGDTTTTGALSAACSYATASVMWYDGLGRAIATADYGREDIASGLAHYFFDGTTGALIDADSDGIPDVAQNERPETYLENAGSLAGLDFQLSLTEYDCQWTRTFTRLVNPKCYERLV